MDESQYLGGWQKHTEDENVKKKLDDERKRLERKQFIKRLIKPIRLDESLAATFDGEETLDIPC